LAPQEGTTASWLGSSLQPTGKEMVEIPAVAASGNQPAVAAYFLDRTEVTVAAYAACVNAGKCTAPPTLKEGDRFQVCNWGEANRKDNPINCVTWPQADAYCRWNGKRLPTREEWLAAARARDGRKYAWGDQSLSDTFPTCWARDDKREGTCPVGAFPGTDTAEGVKDLFGNVAEWTSNCANDYCDKRLLHGISWYSSAGQSLDVTKDADFVEEFGGNGIRCARDK
jgi:formylglycine-generating enzyme required for sulfatase activity